MALIGEMKYLQIGSNTYEIPTSELPIASSSTLGGIKVGTNLSIDNSTGVLSASFTETDPVFSASAAAGITATDITNWDNKVSDTGKWNDVSLNKTISDLSNQEAVIPFLWNSSDTVARFAKVSKVPSYNCIAQYNNGYLNSTTPSANDNSTKVATTAYVDACSLPTGGTAGQVLKKTSTTNYDVEWGAVDALPSITSSDNNKVLMVVNGAWAAASLPTYNGGVS